MLASNVSTRAQPSTTQITPASSSPFHNNDNDIDITDLEYDDDIVIWQDENIHNTPEFDRIVSTQPNVYRQLTTDTQNNKDEQFNSRITKKQSSTLTMCFGGREETAEREKDEFIDKNNNYVVVNNEHSRNGWLDSIRVWLCF